MLHFIYGAMNSSKTANLLMTRFNYHDQGYSVRVIKPDVDTRNLDSEGNIIIKSRIGLQCQCDVVSKSQSLSCLLDKDAIFVDEAQFLTSHQVDELRVYALDHHVYCYGLLTDFKTNLFEGSKRLVELADQVTKLDTFDKNGHYASVNARFIDGHICTSGAVESIESDEVEYRPMCFDCYFKEIQNELNHAGSNK